MAWHSLPASRTGSPVVAGRQLGVLVETGILSFDSVIAGWAVAYVWFVATGAVTGVPDDSAAFFSEFTATVVDSAAPALCRDHGGGATRRPHRHRAGHEGPVVSAESGSSRPTPD